jgi:hypothetical protein
MITRRQFNKTLALTTAGVAALGTKAFAADTNPLSAYGANILTEPAPINVGPAPLWKRFEYIARIFTRNRTTVGWHGWIEGKEYGDYIKVSDVIDYNDPIIAEACLLLKEQADDTRHELIKALKYPCFCMMCKANASIDMKVKRVGKRVSAFTNMNGKWENDGWVQGQHSHGLVTTIRGKGKGFVRAAEERCDMELHRMIMALEGPTNGYRA